MADASLPDLGGKATLRGRPLVESVSVFMNNWANNVTYHADRVHTPDSTGQVAEIVGRASRVHALGSRHSFNAVPDAEGGDLISLAKLDRLLEINDQADTPTARVEAGIRYSDLALALHAAGYALPNMASLPHISVVGACSTGTHGSGNANPCLAAAVSAVKVVHADGSIRDYTRQSPEFPGLICGLGAMGVIVEAMLDLLPTFDVEQRVYENLPFDKLDAPAFERVSAGGYSVSLFTDWQGGRFNQVWVKSKVGEPHVDLREFGATPATRRMHMAEGSVAAPQIMAFTFPEKCTEQLGVAGPWNERLPHFRPEEEPSSSGRELQSEYILPREHAVEAMATMFAMGDCIRPLIQISEIRTMAADELWMSPFYQRDSVGIHFTWMPDEPGVRELLPDIEAALEPFEPRPHWGKIFTMAGGALRSRYPRVIEFRQLAGELDRTGKFRNEFLNANVFGM